MIFEDLYFIMVLLFADSLNLTVFLSIKKRKTTVYILMRQTPLPRNESEATLWSKIYNFFANMHTHGCAQFAVNHHQQLGLLSGPAERELKTCFKHPR
jgi:hypothetical protein